MKGGKEEKKGNPLDEIKRIEQKREERRIKMEDMKKEKEEKKAYNLASGKNVDIDFEIMIDKSRFKEKILSPHVSSVENKVLPVPLSSLSACGSAPSSRRRSRTAKSTPFLRRTRRSACTSRSSRWTASPSTWKTTVSRSTTLSTKKR